MSLRIVMRDLAGDMVQDMGLRNTVSSASTDPAHEASEVTKQTTVQSRQSTTRESELGSTVMGEERVGVLQEGDQDQPVVHPG